MELNDGDACSGKDADVDQIRRDVGCAQRTVLKVLALAAFFVAVLLCIVSLPLDEVPLVAFVVPIAAAFLWYLAVGIVTWRRTGLRLYAAAWIALSLAEASFVIGILINHRISNDPLLSAVFGSLLVLTVVGYFTAKAITRRRHPAAWRTIEDSRRRAGRLDILRFRHIPNLESPKLSVPIH